MRMTMTDEEIIGEANRLGNAAPMELRKARREIARSRGLRELFGSERSPQYLEARARANYWLALWRGEDPMEARLMQTYDMRRPSEPDYADALNVTVRRLSIVERMRAAWWLLFQNWRA